MIDVFITTLPYREEDPIGRIRINLAQACIERWQSEPDTWRIVVTASEGREVEFQRDRRIQAENRSTGPYYILADDDCMLETRFPYIERAVSIMDKHPDFAILSFFPINFLVVPWTPADSEKKLLIGGRVFTDDDVMEHVNSGGIRLCRKGAMKKWPPMDAGSKSYDMIHCCTLRADGWRSGYFKSLRMLHLGRHYSNIWRPLKIDDLM
jgi:hypothetical protein